MGHTFRHIVLAAAWLFTLPLLVMAWVSSGPSGLWTMTPAVFTAAWGAGLAAVFASWALRDAPAHGKPRAVAWGFTAAWLVMFFLAVFPYLFVTRGARGGFVAALKFAALLVVLGLVWLGVPLVVGGLFELGVRR